MRLVCLPSSLGDAAGWYRVLLPGQVLAREGWEAVVPPYAVERLKGGRGGLRRLAHYGLWRKDGGGARLAQSLEEWLCEADFDVLLMQQRKEPFWPDAIGRLRGQGKRVLVDSDDAWFGLPSWNPGSRMTRPELDAMTAQLAAADGLSVATPALAGMYRRWQPNVRVIRNRLDWGMWADTAPVYERPTRRLRVGWMGATYWRSQDLTVLRGVLGPWLEQHPQVEFVAAGDPRTHDLLGIPEPQRVSVAETEFDNRDLADITAVFDIGLVPLDLGRDGRTLNECKSHLKGLEYGASGIPFVASPSESYRWWVNESNAGLLAATPMQWRAALDRLLDPGYRLELGRNGRRAAQRWSIQEGGADEWGDWLGSGADRDTPVALLAA